MGENLAALCERLRYSQCYTDYWKNISLYFYHRNLLNEECFLTLIEILSSEMAEEVFKVLEYDIKDPKKSIAALEESFCRLEDMFSRRNSYWHKSPEVMSIVQEFGVNEEKYIDKFFEAAPLYLVLYQMFKDNYDTLYSRLESEKLYQRFGKRTLAFGDYYCISPIYDLVVSNVYRGKLYKREPKDLAGKIEYDYARDGCLLVRMWYSEIDYLYSIEFFIYTETKIIRVEYDKGGARLKGITLQTYEGELISSMGHALFYFGQVVTEMWFENYIYTDSIMKEGWEQHYRFPGRPDQDKEFLSARRQYVFEWDSDDLICGYWYKEWCGDGPLTKHWSQNILKLSDKKRKDTGKDAGRWRRPNYFRE
ncbi:hypothetical protein NXH76_21995 [Blautia schinkii]|nr:hypothetical protein [Blautia schinkii]